MAATPAARLLSLLEILQARPSATAAELSAALDVTERTLRRYVARLIDLGVPVDSARGPCGGYRLRPGFRLPPLMLSGDEAVAAALGLLATQRLGVRAVDPAATSALAKLQRVLPDEPARQVRALEQALGFTTPPARAEEVDPDVLAALGAGVGERRRLRIRYRPQSGEDSERAVDPYGVVFHAGRWYMVGYDHLREDLRTFRVDRMAEVTRSGEAFRPPEDFDAVEHLVGSLAATPYAWDVEVVLHTDTETARALVPATVGTISRHPDGALLEVSVASLESAAVHLLWLDTPFAIVRPPELRGALRELAHKAGAAAER